MKTPSSDLFAALADPARLAILDRLLTEGPQTAGGLAGALKLSPPTASRHYKTLEQAGLIERRVDAQRRILALRPEPFRDMRDWLERHERFWTESLDRLDDYLSSSEKEPHNDD